jgi:hypothetical protein
MKKTIMILVFGFISTVTFGQTRHPYYGGGHHTSSHSGYYSGGHGSSHRGGHYTNRKTYNTYGRHKRY